LLPHYRTTADFHRVSYSHLTTKRTPQKNPDGCCLPARPRDAFPTRKHAGPARTHTLQHPVTQPSSFKAFPATITPALRSPATPGCGYYRDISQQRQALVLPARRERAEVGETAVPANPQSTARPPASAARPQSPAQPQRRLGPGAGSAEQTPGPVPTGGLSERGAASRPRASGAGQRRASPRCPSELPPPLTSHSR